MNQENQGVNYSMALKNYNQNGRGRSMRKQGVGEESAKHNAFMFSVIESCKMNKRSVEGDDLTNLLPCNLAT